MTTRSTEQELKLDASDMRMTMMTIDMDESMIKHSLTHVHGDDVHGGGWVDVDESKSKDSGFRWK